MATVKMDWVRDYCVEKVLEVVVRWQVKHPTTLAVSPITVVKRRVKAGEAMLEVEWAKTCPPCLCSTSKYPCTMPAPFAAVVPTVEFSEAFPQVFHNFQAKLDAKEAAKKKPRSKKGKENLEVEGLESKGKKKRAIKNKADEKQPMISYFVQSEAQRQIGEDESLDRPKNIVFKKLVSKDKAFNNKVISSKMLTPKEVDSGNVEKQVGKVQEDEELGDSFVLRTVPSKLDEDKEDSNEDLFTDSVRQFMDSGDDSDPTLGPKGKPRRGRPNKKKFTKKRTTPRPEPRVAKVSQYLKSLEVNMNGTDPTPDTSVTESGPTSRSKYFKSCIKF